MSTSRSSARRPRRPGDARHDPDGVNQDELLDERPLNGSGHQPVLCEEVLLLRANVDCPKCGQRTPVHAMVGSPEFETDDETSSLLRRIASLPPPLDKAAREYGRGLWRRDQSEQVAGAHWHSHCKHCSARLGEAFVLGADGPFQPRLYRQRIAIKALRLHGPFVLDGVQRQRSPAMLAWLDWFRQREAKAAAPKRAKRRSPAGSRQPTRPAAQRRRAPAR